VTTLVPGSSCRLSEPLARHTAWRTGGVCAAWFVVHRRYALPRVLAACRERGWRWNLLGAGTRTVARDGGVAGAVIRLGTDFATVERDGGCWTVGAAVPVPALLAAASELGQGGLETLGAVPGTVGASLALDPWPDVVESVSFLRRGSEREGSLEEARARGLVVTGARLRLDADRPEAVRARVRARLDGSGTSTWVRASDQLDPRSALTRADLAGVRLRRVAIPPAAPEILVNLGGGTAADLDLLHRAAVERVRRHRGVELETVIRWLGKRESPPGRT